MTIPLKGASPNRLITELEIDSTIRWRSSLLVPIRNRYMSAPFANEGIRLFETLIGEAQGNLVDFLTLTLGKLARLFQINATIDRTSRIYPRGDKRGEERIIDICVHEGASIYINPPGGRCLYNHEQFQAAGVELRFLDPCLSSLPIRSSGNTNPDLSILDIVMNNDLAMICQALKIAKLMAG